MIKKAFLRANIPFTIQNFDFDDEVVQSFAEKGWSKFHIEGDFLLKHINTSLNKNVFCFSKPLDNISYSVPMADPTDPTIKRNYKFVVNEICIYCFDTGIGIASIHIPYDEGVAVDALINTCSVLRSSAKQANASNGMAVLRDGKETYLSCLAEEELSEIFGEKISLFNQFNENSMRRIDMFSAALCPKPSEVDCDTSEEPETKLSREADNLSDRDNQNQRDILEKTCYLLANALDTRDIKGSIDMENIYRQHSYNRWCFSKRGCAVVANLTDTLSTDKFLSTRWFLTLKSNYFYLYLMVLHQKYAIYNYLNTVAADTENSFIKANQEALIDFNSKYVFSIVSDEQFIQNAYLHMREINNVDEVYIDLQDELRRLFEYSQLRSEENNEIRNNKLNIISVIISVLCSVSIIFETLNMFNTHGGSLGFDSRKDILCTSVIILELLMFVAGLIVVYKINQKRD